MGSAKAKYYLLTGQPLSGKLCSDLNLVSLSLPKKEEVLIEAKKVALTISQGPNEAIKDTKFAINSFLKQQALIGGNLSLSLEMLNFKEQDAKEGLKAIMEKRKPKFKL